MTLQSYRESHPAFSPSCVEVEPGWLRGFRDSELKRLEEGGFPTVKVEEWRYSNPAKVTGREWRHLDAGGAIREGAVEASRIDGAAAELVFVDGIFNRELSRLSEMGEGVTIAPLSEAFSTMGELVEGLLSRPADGFTAANGAFLQDGALVHLSRGVEVEGIIHLIFTTSEGASGAVSHCRNLVVLERGAAGVLVESHLSRGQNLANSHSEIVLQEEAALEHHIWQRGGNDSSWIGRSEITQGRDSAYDSHTFWLGGGWVRHDLRVRLQQPGAFCNLDGLYLLDGDQHLDNHTEIQHRAPHCTSRELYKGIIGGRGRAVFNGKVLVEKPAQRTDSEQANHNLLLSRGAEIDTKPELEIYADDVKCAHGATTGQLNETSLYYLRTRGIPEAKAVHMLTEAFALEQVEAVEEETLNAKVASYVNERLERMERGE